MPDCMNIVCAACKGAGHPANKCPTIPVELGPDPAQHQLLKMTSGQREIYALVAGLALPLTHYPGFLVFFGGFINKKPTVGFFTKCFLLFYIFFTI